AALRPTAVPQLHLNLRSSCSTLCARRPTMQLRPLMVLAAFLLFAVALPADDRGEQDKLQGTWAVTSGEEGGKPLPAAKVDGGQVCITKARVRVRNKEDNREMTYKLDPSKQPKTIDLTTAEGPDKGKTAHGIYVLDGDTLKICFAPPGKERPADFSTKPGS